MKENSSKRIAFLGGLKGGLAVLIVFLHYILSFFPYGFIGFGTGYSADERYQVYFQNYPLSLLLQLTLLPLFYAMIAYIPAIKIFRDGNTLFIERQALVRYFRLMPPVLATALFSYAVYAFGFSEHLAISELLGNEWMKAANYTTAESWLGAVKNGVWETFAYDGAGGYCSVLWCIKQIFVGSFLTYGFLLLFRSVNCRLPIYLVCYLILLKYPNYCGFLSGIAAADFYVHVPAERQGRFAVPFLILSILLAIIPKPIMPAWFRMEYSEGLASFFLVCAIPCLPWLDRLLSGKIVNWLGARSFSLILTHFPIMVSVSAIVFEKTYAAHMPQFLCMLAALLAGLPLIMIASEFMYRLVEIPTGRLTKRLAEKWITSVSVQMGG